MKQYSVTFINSLIHQKCYFAEVTKKKKKSKLGGFLRREVVKINIAPRQDCLQLFFFLYLPFYRKKMLSHQPHSQGSLLPVKTVRRENLGTRLLSHFNAPPLPPGTHLVYHWGIKKGEIKMSSCSLPGNASFIYTRLRDQKITKYLMQQKMYTYTVNSLKSISVLNLSLFAVYTFYRKNLRVFGFISFATGKTFLQYICPMFIIKHPMFSYTLFVSFSSKMEVATLLSASLDHGVWNQ